jgi:hypothetical protein
MSSSGSVIRVLINPGATALTRIPSSTQRRARFLVKATRPAFDELYAGTATADTNADIDAMLTTLLPPSAVLALSFS